MSKPNYIIQGRTVEQKAEKGCSLYSTGKQFQGRFQRKTANMHQHKCIEAVLVKTEYTVFPQVLQEQ